MRNLLISFGTSLFLNQIGVATLLRGVWALPVMFVFAMCSFVWMDAILPAHEPRVGMTIQQFDAVCPEEHLEGDEDAWPVENILTRTRIYTKKRQKGKCYGIFIFDVDGKLSYYYR